MVVVYVKVPASTMLRRVCFTTDRTPATLSSKPNMVLSKRDPVSSTEMVVVKRVRIFLAPLPVIIPNLLRILYAPALLTSVLFHFKNTVSESISSSRA